MPALFQIAAMVFVVCCACLNHTICRMLFCFAQRL